MNRLSSLFVANDRCSGRLSKAVFWLTLQGLATHAMADAGVVYLGDPESGVSLEHTQAWGDFGFNVATAGSGGTGAPLRIGETTYARGLGHHASGQVTVPLRGQYSRFQAA